VKKGDYLIKRSSNKIYVIVGRWDKEIVIADTDPNSEEVLIYGPEELESLISEGKFGKLHKTGIKIEKEV